VSLPLPLENIRLSQEARDRLVTLKRRTGIANWNVLCRWALCRSLAEETPPPRFQAPADSNVEMSWRVFAGAYGDVFLGLLKVRCKRDGLPLDAPTLAEQFRLHLHRGIGYLAADRSISSIRDLFRLALSRSSSASWIRR